MASVDLIPAEYRHWTWQLLWLRRSIAAYTAIFAITLLSYLFFLKQGEQFQKQLVELQSQQAVTQLQQTTLEALTHQSTELRRQWDLLNGLRGGVSVTDVLLDIDKALTDEQVWFVDWQFNRAGEIVDEKLSLEESGYFIMIKRNDSPDAVPEKWRINSHIKIKGEAIDHVAFSTFIQKLLDRPSVADVRVVNTRMQAVQNLTEVIGFEVAVLINNRAGYSDA